MEWSTQFDRSLAQTRSVSRHLTFGTLGLQTILALYECSAKQATLGGNVLQPYALTSVTSLSLRYAEAYHKRAQDGPAPSAGSLRVVHFETSSHVFRQHSLPDSTGNLPVGKEPVSQFRAHPLPGAVSGGAVRALGAAAWRYRRLPGFW